MYCGELPSAPYKLMVHPHTPKVFRNEPVWLTEEVPCACVDFVIVRVAQFLERLFFVKLMRGMSGEEGSVRNVRRSMRRSAINVRSIGV